MTEVLKRELERLRQTVPDNTVLLFKIGDGYCLYGANDCLVFSIATKMKVERDYDGDWKAYLPCDLYRICIRKMNKLSNVALCELGEPKSSGVCRWNATKIYKKTEKSKGGM